MTTLWLPITEEQAAAAGGEIAEAYQTMKGEIESYAAAIGRARDQYATDEVEIDGAPSVSPSGDGGTWVMGWLYVESDQDDEEDDDEEEGEEENGD